jgi:hypothetical protein
VLRRRVRLRLTAVDPKDVAPEITGRIACWDGVEVQPEGSRLLDGEPAHELGALLLEGLHVDLVVLEALVELGDGGEDPLVA